MAKSAAKDGEKKPGAPIYLLFGDEFLVKERLRVLLDELVEPALRDTNLFPLDGSNLNLSELSSHLFTPSLFGGPRVVVVEQTTAFMGRADQGKILGKITQAWESGDRKAAFRAFGQWLSLVGAGSKDLEGGPEGLILLLDDSASAEAREALIKVATAFRDEGKKISSKGQEAALDEFIQADFGQGVTLIFVAVDVDKRNKLFKLVDKRGHVEQLTPREEKYGAGLERPFFEARVRAALEKAGKTISARGMEKIYSMSGKELRRLHSEVEKLIGYVGARTEITVEDVDAAFSDFHEAGFFDFTNAVRSGDLAKCLPALHEHLRLGAHPLNVLTMISNEIRRLMAARELLFTVFRGLWKPNMSFQAFSPVLKKAREDRPDLMKKGKLHLLSMNDYAVYYAIRDVQKFTMEKLARSLEACLDADIMMKSTRLGSHAAQALLEQVLFAVCSPPRKSAPPPRRLHVDNRTVAS